MRMKFMRRLFIRPARRLGRTIINILIFDIASTVYAYSKGWFREPRTKAKREEEEIGNCLNQPGIKRRRW